MAFSNDYEIIPECSLRSKYVEYILGMNICQAISLLQKLSRNVKGVELLYNHDDPLKQDIILSSTQEGFKLIFDSDNQQLKMIEIYDLNKITLRYCSSTFSVPYEKTTVEQVEHAFGATHPGTYDAGSQTYILNWRGISFSFFTEPNVQPLSGRGLGSLQFSDGSAPVVNKICIFSGNSIAECRPPEMPLSCYNGNCHLDSMEIIRQNNKCCGLAISAFSETFECTRFAEVKRKNFRTKILFGDSCQDVSQRLGCPNRLYYKDEDKMKIHLPSDQRLKIDNRTCRADYFFNYFTLGLDILFNGETNKVKKFVLRTNFPGHYDFGIYYRCKFNLNINLADGVTATSSPSAMIADEFESAAESEASAKSTMPGEKAIEINPFTKWDYVYNLVFDPLGDILFSTTRGNDESSSNSSGIIEIPPTKQSPVVLNRSNTNNSSNPFGSTFCYCYVDIIFEVMHNNHIASLTLFDDAFRGDD